MSAELQNPAGRCAAVTPSDSVALSPACRALYIGGAGNVAIKDLATSATAVTFVGVAAGTVLPVRASLVMSTNTTATSIVALW